MQLGSIFAADSAAEKLGSCALQSLQPSSHQILNTKLESSFDSAVTVSRWSEAFQMGLGVMESRVIIIRRDLQVL